MALSQIDTRRFAKPGARWREDLASDIDAAGKALDGVKNSRIHTFISSSDVHLMHQMKKDRESIMAMAVDSVKRAKQYVEDVEFSPMDASRTDMNYLYQLIEAAIEAGATTINVPDTVGYSMPWEFRERIEKIKQNGFDTVAKTSV